MQNFNFMKSTVSQVLFVAFMMLATIVKTNAQTTVTLPTIPCPTCNGPGSFATTAPNCTSGLVGAPLTMSWGTATGATSYTILIATDATFTQDLATYTLTGTSLSVPAYALKPQITYYWTVVANNVTGSTKATGNTCTFSTNNTWTGTSATGGFPKGSGSQKQLNDGIAGGYYDCRSGDGTCASGDNMICNPKFEPITTSTAFAPNWIKGYTGGQNGGTYYTLASVDLTSVGAGTPTTGTNTGLQFNTTYPSFMVALQPMFERNTTSTVQNYRLTFWAKANDSNAPQVLAGFYKADGATGNETFMPYYYFSASNTVSTNTTTSWTQYTLNVTLGANTASTIFALTTNSSTNGRILWLTDVVLCKL